MKTKIARLLQALKIARMIYRKDDMKIILASMVELGYYYADTLCWYTELTDKSIQISTRMAINGDVCVKWTVK